MLESLSYSVGVTINSICMFCNFESWYILRLFFHLRGFHYPKHICSLTNDRKIYVQLFHLVILINIICLSMYFICGCLIFYIGFILFWICYIHVIILILIIFHISFAKPCFWWKCFFARRDVLITRDSICYLGIKDGPQDCLVLP